jgi:hypothetical protein
MCRNKQAEANIMQSKAHKVRMYTERKAAGAAPAISLLLRVPTTASMKEAAPLAAKNITMTVGWHYEGEVRRREA